MSTQLIGFSIGGICKRFLVAPPSMIWPANLVFAALFNTLHAQETSGSHSRGGISRPRFFTYVSVGYMFYSQSVWSSTNFLCLFILIGRCLRLLALLSLHCSVNPFLGMLDSSQQCQDQSAIRRHPRHGHGYHHPRLGSNRLLRRLSSCDALVGCSQHWVHHRDFLLDHHRLSLRA
jgi:hypothetical protein